MPKNLKNKITEILITERSIEKAIGKTLNVAGEYSGVGRVSIYSFGLNKLIFGKLPKRFKYNLRIPFKNIKGIHSLVNDSIRKEIVHYAVIKKGEKSYALIPGTIKGNNSKNLKNLYSLSEILFPVISLYEDYVENKQLHKDFDYMVRIGILLNSTLSQKIIRKKTIEAITELLDAEAGSLLLVDEEKNELYFEVALGEKGDVVKEIRLKIGEGVAGWVAKTGRPTIVNDPESDKRWYRKADEKSKFQTRNILCVPVKTKDKVIGVLQALNKKNGEFSKYDLEIFEIFANQVATALENARLYEELKQTFIETSSALASSIEARDKYTGGHTQRVLNYSLAVAKELGLEEKEIEILKIAAVLHDIGKIGVEDAILRKPGRLDERELREMKKHPEIGAEIISKIKALKNVVPAVLYHQEMYDGSGYPEGLKNGEIPLLARIISVVDTFDAMTTDRPYRKALPDEVALKELKTHAGKQFDPEVVEAFIRAYENKEIRNG